jgi:hypothetical protein
VTPFQDETYCVQKFENAWQFLKFYMDQSIEEWREWARDGFSSESAQRFPQGRGAVPLGSLWKGDTLRYVEARIVVYAPLYARCVLEHASEALEYLRALYKKGPLALFDYDGYAHRTAGLTLQDVIYNTRRKMGHAFVLAGLIEGDHFWETKYDVCKEHATSVPRLREIL